MATVKDGGFAIINKNSKQVSLKQKNYEIETTVTTPITRISINTKFLNCS